MRESSSRWLASFVAVALWATQRWASTPRFLPRVPQGRGYSRGMLRVSWQRDRLLQIEPQLVRKCPLRLVRRSRLDNLGLVIGIDRKAGRSREVAKIIDR